MSKALGKNPLLNEDPILTEKDIETIKHTVSDADQFTTASFKIRKAYLKKLKDYAYTERLEQKEALDQALEAFLGKIKDENLLECPEKPKVPRKSRMRG